ncbi:MAG: GHKL domain-containing protein, partial [Bacteroidales bacterium]|nr:GHKL domain-containing protein [Bacteroidales bacterium]
QYLQKAWTDGAEDYEVRMHRITEGLKEQITVLSHTADQFSTFATINETTLVHLELKTIINDVISIFNSSRNITFKQVFITENNIILADKTQMIRILNNVYKNAIQAIGDQLEGQITTELNTTATAANMIISDDGCGIKPEELNSIFEPHFTTKSSGMGLGLSLVKKMVENVGGEISVKSDLHKGSTFSIVFPIKKS